VKEICRSVNPCSRHTSGGLLAFPAACTAFGARVMESETLTQCLADARSSSGQPAGLPLTPGKNVPSLLIYPDISCKGAADGRRWDARVTWSTVRFTMIKPLAVRPQLAPVFAAQVRIHCSNWIQT
jgi:hypothetical protein